MKVYPAIDILGGKAVRLRQGRASDATVYGDPLEMAVKWVSQGAEWLHVVDLDGAFEGKPKNIELLRDMVAAVPLAKIQVGGGIRSMLSVESLLDAGIQRVVLGTAAVRDQTFVKQAITERTHNIAIGIDARDELLGKAHVDLPPVVSSPTPLAVAGQGGFAAGRGVFGANTKKPHRRTAGEASFRTRRDGGIRTRDPLKPRL